MTKITDKMMLKAIPNSGGILSHIAKKCGVSRVNLYNFLERNPKYREIIEQERESIIDMAESSLFLQAKEKQPWATKFILATIGKKRGYVEKQEMEYSGGLTLRADMTNRFNESLATARTQPKIASKKKQIKTVKKKIIKKKKK